MDNQFSAADLEFQQEVRAFFKQAFTDDLRTALDDGTDIKGTMEAWQKKLYEKGWVAPDWPVEYGGTGWTPVQKFIFETERSRAGAPEVVPFGLRMVAPVIFTFGSDEQKETFLPRILRSDDWWCQGYSEPGAGSDLAALQTRATLDGDHYVVNGAKIWTTYAQHADWIFCLVRTGTFDKRQQGISFLLIDMKSEGITVNPIHSIDNYHSLNEVVFDNVRVPVANRVGNEHQGWTYAKALLAHERTSIAAVAESRRGLSQIVELAEKQTNANGRLIDDPVFQTQVSDIEIELMALEYMDLRVLASLSAGDTPGPEASLLKIKGTEIQQAIQELRMQTIGAYAGALKQDSFQNELHRLGSNARRSYMYGRAATIYGGSNEVQRNVIAKAVLGL
ncbi:acyl-CoA dehydrogenase [Arenicella chitinivorans]|uniref:Acyl-CoA dehydrogenase n=1 Tax=Arenicella chitinivorans TaxID=1329800 RepID=A0A918RHS1_9GAMM|nr:acyl-CoA dehydrogenase family protein [Arenicella chitinivorans]GGZ98614.1 acyl-CoA dehydrogenase [Arenicella chitinivorans]